jgi:TRAP transporter TAXI family solute receptor
MEYKKTDLRGWTTMRKILFLMLVGLLAVFAVACGGNTASDGTPSNDSTPSSDANTSTDSSATAEVPADITFGAATVGGFWYTLAGAFGEDIQATFPGSSVTVVEGGSISNLLGLSQGVFSVGFSNGQTVPEGLNGVGPFEEKITNVSTIATLYPNVFHIAVRADSDIYSVEDLRGKRVSPGISGYSGELAFIEILELNGMTYDDLARIEYVGTADGADLLRDGHIDAIVGMLAAPVSTYQELDTTVGIRLVPLEQSTIDGLFANNPGYLDYTIPAGTYSNIKEDVKTVAGFTVLLVNNDLLNEEAVYQLTKTVVENRDKWETLSKVMADFDAEFSVKNSVGKLHPGAERYYKEVGAIK